MLAYVCRVIHFTIFGTNCCCCVLIMSGKVIVCVDEGPEEKKARKVSQSPFQEVAAENALV